LRDSFVSNGCAKDNDKSGVTPEKRRVNRQFRQIPLASSFGIGQNKSSHDKLLQSYVVGGEPNAENTMSLFGKILAFLNIFAVLGTVSLMAMSYAKRQSWQYAVFRQQLMVDGLPLDDKQVDEQGEPLVALVGEKTQQDLFKQVSPSTPVATQVAEVDRVKQELDNQIRSAPDKKKQIYLLSRFLAPTAVTFEKRLQAMAYETYLRDEKTFEELKSRLKSAHDVAAANRAKPYEETFHDAINSIFRDPPGPLAEAYLAIVKSAPATPFEQALDQSLDNQLTQLRGQFEQMFTDAKEGGEGIKGGAPAQRKNAIARLLFDMVEAVPSPSGGNAPPDLGNPAYRRFITVVGLKTGLDIVNERAVILQDLAFEADLERLRERNLFAVQHRKVVDLARDKKAEVDSHTLLLARKQKEYDVHQTALEKRKRDVAYYQEHLSASRAKTAERLQKLQKLSDDLLRERIKLHRNTLDNQQLEKELRTLEEGR
jgi:hypothetical protein